VSAAVVPVDRPRDRSADFCVVVWDDGAVVFDEADGSLHALTSVAGEAFQCLLEKPDLTPRQLGRLLMRSEPTSSDVRMLEHLLQEFDAMGLWERTAA
jgi:PqqD family protein of HPr-rel-A system